MHTDWEVTTFVDLDDTLFSSKRRHAPTAELFPAATLENGEVISYSCHKQRFLQNLLQRAGKMIPVTARNLGAFQRVMLSFEHGAVLSHGATILNKDGNTDVMWQMEIHRQVGTLADEFAELLHRVQSSRSYQQNEIRAWLVYDADVPVYAVVKDNDRDESRLARFVQHNLVEWLLERPVFRLHANGNNIAIIPTCISKESAVSYLMAGQRAVSPGVIFIGAGDSVTDEPFMHLCDFWITPTNSQLAMYLRRFIQLSGTVDPLGVISSEERT